MTLEEHLERAEIARQIEKEPKLLAAYLFQLGQTVDEVRRTQKRIAALLTGTFAGVLGELFIKHL